MINGSDTLEPIKDVTACDCSDGCSAEDCDYSCALGCWWPLTKSSAISTGQYSVSVATRLLVKAMVVM